MKTPTFSDLVGGTLALGALGVVSFVVISTGNETGLGALVALLSAGTGFFLRGKVEAQRS